MSSRHVRPLLSAYLDGEATPEERRQVERHLAGCPDCARVLAEYRDTGSQIRELSRPLPPATLHGDVWRAIERGETQVRWGPATAGWLRLGAIAAVLVLAVVIGWGIINRPGPQAAAHPVDPSRDEKNVARNTTIVIDFDKPVAEYLREPSAIPSVFDLSPPGVYVPSWGANGQELYINPTADWAAQTTYTVTVLTSTIFTDGTHLAAPVSWNFTTGVGYNTPTATPTDSPTPTDTPAPTETPLLPSPEPTSTAPPLPSDTPAPPAPTAVAQGTTAPPPVGPPTVTTAPSNTPAPPPATSTHVPPPPASSTPVATHTALPPLPTVPATVQPEPSQTPGPPSATAVPPSRTPEPPSRTPVPPSRTPVPPTATPVPPTATPEPPTATPEPPTATPEPATATPEPPTATPEPPTATPTQVIACASQPQGSFGEVYRSHYAVRNTLGCPEGSEDALTYAATQPFEHGLMFWNGDTKQIYVFDGNAMSWSLYPDTWQEGDADATPTPPPGLYAPVRGFGKVWFANADVRQRLGWATAPESEASAAIQEFEHGTMLRFDPASVRILYKNQSHVWEQFSP